jgi:hypothetical protein
MRHVEVLPQDTVSRNDGAAGTGAAPVVYQRLGEIAESRGRAADAIRYHAWLIDLWRDADVSLHNERDAIRKRLEVLAGSRG